MKARQRDIAAIQKRACNDLNNEYNNKMEPKKSGHGGAREGGGRKPLKEGAITVPVVTRMTVEQRGKLAQLGGAPWVRTRIDKAKLPKE